MRVNESSSVSENSLGTGTNEASSFRHRFTVFTPTYDRAHTLPRVYASLCAQTLRDFEWLVVDDGSRDHTAASIKAWQQEAPFPIRYFYQENAGKHVAFNKGVAEAQGELFLPADADDAFVPHALARLLFHWENIPPADRPRFSGVTGLCQDENGRRVGTGFPREVMDSDSLEMIYRYKVRGENWGFHRTAVLRQFPFPETPRRIWIPESLVWHPIARHYRTRFVNEPLRLYFQGQVDQISQSSARRFAPGRKLFYLQVLNEELDWFSRAPLIFVKAAVQFARFSFLSNEGARTQWRSLENYPSRGLWLAGVVPAWVIALLDQRGARPR
jgi:glycosyltransferase involved in cell wall biosynthesis